MYTVFCMILAVSVGVDDMKSRKESATVQLKVRLKEPLRARIEKAARKQEHPMNTEIVDRLEKSFSKDQERQLTHQLVMDGVFEQFGSEGKYSFVKLMAEAIDLIEDETGKSWQEDSKTYEEVEAACKAILSRYGPEAARPTEPTTDPLRRGEAIAAVLAGGRGGSRARQLLKMDVKPKSKPKTVEE